jgi:hypothetical protein
VGHVAIMEGMRNKCNILVKKTERKWPLGRRGRRRDDNIKTDVGEIV